MLYTNYNLDLVDINGGGLMAAKYTVENFSATLLTMRWQIEMTLCNTRSYDDWCPASHVDRLAHY